jgi:integrase
VPELCDLRWDQVEFAAAVLHVRRVKNGTPSTHPLRGEELRALRRLQRESESSPFVFISERGAPFTTAGFARMVERSRGDAILISPIPLSTVDDASQGMADAPSVLASTEEGRAP